MASPSQFSKEVTIAFLFSLLCTTLGANILVFISVGGYSHRIPMQGLLDTLADKGHNITVLSAFPAKVPNPKVVDLSPPKLLEWNAGWSQAIDLVTMRKSRFFVWGWFLSYSLGVTACQSLYSDPEFMKWLQDPNTKVDLILFDTLCSECIYGLAHHFKAILVGFNSGQVYPWDLEAHWGLPDETSSIRDVMWNMPLYMNFYQRALTAIMPLVWKAYRELWILPQLEAVTKVGLGLAEVPSFKEIEQNTSLYFVNNNWAKEHPRSFPPNVIPVGGIALAKGHQKKPLPKYIDDFIKEGKEGFIYMSFGSVAEFAKFGPEIKKEFLGMFRKFPKIQFILRSGQPIEELLPKNVLVDKWLPQMDILAHPKIRLFITHGGLGGIYEAIYSKIPMICIPLFAEQEFNADLMVHKGYAIKLELITLKEHEITAAIGKMLNDLSYKRQIERVAKVFSDRPISPLETAVWWMEFVLRHENINEFIRPLSVTQSWWVRRQLDVWAFISMIFVTFAGSVLFGLWFILKLICKVVGMKPNRNNQAPKSPRGKTQTRRVKRD